MRRCVGLQGDAGGQQLYRPAPGFPLMKHRDLTRPRAWTMCRRNARPKARDETAEDIGTNKARG